MNREELERDYVESYRRTEGCFSCFISILLSVMAVVLIIVIITKYR